MKKGSPLGVESGKCNSQCNDQALQSLKTKNLNTADESKSHTKYTKDVMKTVHSKVIIY